MNKFIILLLASVTLSFNSYAHSQSETKAQLTSILTDFLSNKVGDDFKNHDSFWADDLIYTSSAGLRFNKAYILDGIKEQASSNEKSTIQQEDPVYSAENIDIRFYGDTAIVAFKLVANTTENDMTTTTTYFNTGTFVLRNKQWQAVAWQATMIPVPDKD